MKFKAEQSKATFINMGANAHRAQHSFNHVQKLFSFRFDAGFKDEFVYLFENTTNYSLENNVSQCKKY